MTFCSRHDLQKRTRISVAVVLLVCSFFIFPDNATALMLELQESEKPPASIEKPPVEELEQVAPAAPAKEASPASEDISQPASSAQSSTPAGTPATGRRKTEKKPERHI